MCQIVVVLAKVTQRFENTKKRPYFFSLHRRLSISAALSVSEEKSNTP